jgi:hypothetical protein
MTSSVQPPERRRCERCDRVECWDEGTDSWRIEREDGTRQVGDPHCIHEWDITGSYNPFASSS